MDSSFDPFVDPLPHEVPLPNAPLERVIAQVRFPQVLSISKREFVASFQEAIREQYPVLQVEQTQEVMFGPQGTMPTPPQVIWRLLAADEKWRVSLALDFLAIETTSYESRTDFLNRFSCVLAALETHVRPKIMQRLGMRYIDRVSGEPFTEIRRLVRSEVLGVSAAPAGQHARSALCEAVFWIPDSPVRLLARWGILPPNATVDPSAVLPLEGPSWLLDLDAFSAEPRPFTPSSVLSEARTLAERTYAFFRWAVEDEFLRTYGGNA